MPLLRSFSGKYESIQFNKSILYTVRRGEEALIPDGGLEGSKLSEQFPNHEALQVNAVKEKCKKQTPHFLSKLYCF